MECGLGIVCGELRRLRMGRGELSFRSWVRRVAENYVQAGSRVILTNTFRATCVSLAPYGLQGQVDINRAGVKISRQAAGDSAMVFASIGPSGKMLLTKEANADQLRDAFSRQARALASEGPDALLIGTMTDLAEARIAAEAALETGLPVIVSLVFDSGKNRDRTIMGHAGTSRDGIDERRGSWGRSQLRARHSRFHPGLRTAGGRYAAAALD